MLIHLAATTFDLDGAFTLRVLPASDFGETRRRMNRIATLDGAAVFNDFGASEADRTIRLEWRPGSAAHEASIERLVRLYQRLRLSCRAGVYLVAPEVYRPAPDKSTLTLLVAEKLSA
jgi:hypothetical protein